MSSGQQILILVLTEVKISLDCEQLVTGLECLYGQDRFWSM